MANLFVAIGEFFSTIIGLAIAIPIFFVLAVLVWFVCTTVFGPVFGTLAAIVVILHYQREG